MCWCSPRTGLKQPLRDTPVSSLATPAVAPASFETVNTDSIPIYTSGHPSAVSSSSQMSTSDVEAAAQRPNSQWEEDYDNKTDVSMSSTPEPEFSMPVTIHGVRVPVKQKRHPFDGLYALRKGEEPPKDITKRLVNSIVLAQIHSFRTKSLDWFVPIEKLNMPELDPAYVYPVQVLTIPVTPFALYLIHTHRGSSATLSPVHRELVVTDRPDLRYVHFSHLHAVENTTGRAHCMNKFLPGNLLAVTRLGRLPNTTAEHFVSSQEGVLQLKKHNFWTVIE
uniref:Uncharacterized protein n=1 Tax=Caenorhabditis japonica TaxID=281687 RepID=A0A8R1ECR6_CAEJA